MPTTDPAATPLDTEISIHLKAGDVMHVVRVVRGPYRGWLEIGPVSVFGTDAQIGQLVEAIASAQKNVMSLRDDRLRWLADALSSYPDDYGRTPRRFERDCGCIAHKEQETDGETQWWAWRWSSCDAHAALEESAADMREACAS